MASPPNITSIPSARDPFLDPRTGLVKREWYMFLLNLFTLTGQGSNTIALDEVLIGPPRIDLVPDDSLTPSSGVSQVSSLESDVAEMVKELEALEMAGRGAIFESYMAENDKRVEALELAPPPELVTDFVDLNVTNLTAENASVSNLTVTTGVVSDGGGFKHARVSTGSIGAGLSALVTVTWTTAFADTDYTVVASVQDSTAATLSLVVVHIETKTAAAVAVRVENTSLGSLTGTLHVIAVHDA